MAFGSACELEYQLLLARDLKFLPNEKQVQLLANINEVKRMLGSLLTKVKGNA
jgi:four helix bundle protein